MMRFIEITGYVADENYQLGEFRGKETILGKEHFWKPFTHLKMLKSGNENKVVVSNKSPCCHGNHYIAAGSEAYVVQGEFYCCTTCIHKMHTLVSARRLYLDKSKFRGLKYRIIRKEK